MSAVRRYYVLTISGIPVAFTDGWYTTGAIDGITYDTLYPYLNPKRGKVRGDKWLLREGKGRAGMLTIGLLNIDNVVSTLFATRLSTSHQTYAMETWAFGDTETTLYGYDHSAFANSGKLYYGLETLTYGAKTNAGGLVTYDRFDTVVRATYGSMGYAHQIKGVDDDDYEVNPAISDHPLKWEGRIVTLWSGEIDANDGLCALEVEHRGTFTDWKTSKGGVEYTITAKSLQGILGKDIGISSSRGMMRTSKSVNLYPTKLFWYISDEDSVFAPETRDTFPAGIYIKWATHPTGESHISLVPGTHTSIESMAMGSDTTISAWSIENTSIGEGNHKVQFTNLSASYGIHSVTFAPTGLGTALGFDGDVIGPFGKAGADDDTLEAPNIVSKHYASRYTDRLYVQAHNIVMASGVNDSLFATNALSIHIKNRIFETVVVARVDAETVDGNNDAYFPVLYFSSDKIAPIWTEKDEGIPVNQAIESDSLKPSMFLTKVLASTDGLLYNGLNDVLPLGWGGELDADYIDISDGKGDGTAADNQTALIFEAMTLEKLFAPIFQLQGWMLCTIRGKLSIARVGEPSIESDSLVITDSVILPGSVFGHQQDASLVVNNLVIDMNYNPSTEEYDRENETISAQDSVAGSSEIGTMKVEARGLYLQYQENVDDYLEDLEDDFTARFGAAPTVVGPLLVSRSIGNICTGDSVYVTSDYIVSASTGTAGVTKKPAFVMECDLDLASGKYTLYLVFGSSWNETGKYCPAGKIDTYVGDTITLDTDYMLPGDDDASHFQAGDVITIHRSTDETKYWTGPVVSVGTNTLNIGAGKTLSDTNPPAAGDKVRYAAWTVANVTEWQQEHAYIADYSQTPPDLGSSEAAKVWK